jgi:hypothetical protein
MICDECETVAHCLKNGCVPKQPSKDEALKMALEALDNSYDYVAEEADRVERMYGNYPTRQGKVKGLRQDERKHMEAITAIKQALAVPVQEPVQEPVQPVKPSLWEQYHAAPPAPVQDLPFGVGGGLVAIKTLLSRDPCVHANTAIEMLDAILAAHPAAQRQWVGLTELEKANLWKRDTTIPFSYADAIEAKIKEKNNGM